MKQFARKTPVKILSFFLCLFALFSITFCAFSAVLLLKEGIYYTPQEQKKQEYFSDLVENDGLEILWGTLRPDNEGYFSGVPYGFSAENTNLRYCLTDPSGNIFATNLNLSPQEMNTEYIFYYEVTGTESGNFYDVGVISLGNNNPYGEQVYTLYAYLQPGLETNDLYALIGNGIGFAYWIRYWIFIFAAFSLFLLLFCYVHLLCVSGRQVGSDQVHPGFFHTVPFDLMLAITLVFFWMTVLWADNQIGGDDLLEFLFLIFYSITALAAFIGLSVSFAARVKDRSLFKNTLIYRVFRLLFQFLRRILQGVKACFVFLFKLIRQIPTVWKTATLLAISVLLDIIILAADPSGEWFLWIYAIAKAVFIAVVLYFSIIIQKLQKASHAMASGDSEYQTDTSLMFGSLKQHGENLNNIAGGMSRAVEAKLTSERMKAELITNISHDIKTPLTSIINYAGLISEKECENTVHKEYAQVLLRKSEHLKRLLEDLVEISKANTGNLEVDLTDCNTAILLSQIAGEFEQRCREAALELVTTGPEEALFIPADSRKIWRVFENLMQNACNYSLPGSRIYLSLEKEGNFAKFSVKNTSKKRLTQSAEELTERFVRGDASRSKEGNGLGLSIAKSLTEAQNGRFEILLDGDLFKVTLIFPLISSKETADIQQNI